MVVDLLVVKRMHFVRILLGIATGALIGAAQDFPPGVDLSQKIAALDPRMEIRGFAIDTRGNLYIAGNTDQPISGAHNFGPRGDGDIFVMKLDPTGQQVLYITVIGGSGNDRASLMKVDDGGNAYVLGFTESADYPYTTFQGTGFVNGVVMLKLNPTGDSLLYNTVLSWPRSVSGWALDSTGAVYFGGSAFSGKLPVTLGAYKSLPADSSASQSGFLAKLNSNGSTLDAATYTGSSSPDVTPISVRPGGGVIFSSDTIVGALDAYLTHLVFSNSLSSTSDLNFIYIGSDSIANLYFIAFVRDINGLPMEGSLAINKYSPGGQQLLKSHPLEYQSFPGAFVSAYGAILLFGLATPNFPIHNAAQPCAANLIPLGTGQNPFLEVISTDGGLIYSTFLGTDILAATTSPVDERPYAIATDFLTGWRGILRFDPAYKPPDHISAGCLVHTATSRVAQASPGTIMTLFGDGLGPDEGASWAGGPPFDVGETRVTVDGKLAPLLYAQRKQINFVMPWSLRTDGALVPICVAASGQMSCLSTKTTVAVPGFFRRSETIAAINQDMTVNSQQHPAAPGSYVSLYLTGAGLLDAPVEDGAVAGFTLRRLTANVSATLNVPAPGQSCSFGCQPSISAEVLFAGAVPTLMYGIEAVILHIPGNMPSGLRGLSVDFKWPGYTASAFGNLWFGP